MTVELLTDKNRLVQDAEDATLIGSPAEYIEAFLKVKQALASNTQLKLVVQDSTCALWFQRFAKNYSPSRVTFHEITARNLLEGKWGTVVPDNVTDTDIINSGVLDSNIPIRGHPTFDEIVLQAFWGDLFLLREFPMRYISDLANQYDATTWQASQRIPLAVRVLALKKREWIAKAKRLELGQLVDRYFADPGLFKTKLFEFQLLRGYPSELGKQIMADWFDMFKRLDVNPSLGLGVEPSRDTISKITVYLNNQSELVRSKQDLLALLDQMSGYLVEEFSFLEQLLHGNIALLQRDLLVKIQTRFRPIRAMLGRRLTSLLDKIPPVRPLNPSRSWPLNEWMKWAVNEYLPYRFWLEEQNQEDAEIADFASEFSDWFYEHLVELKAQHQTSFVSATLNRVHSSAPQSTFVFLLVIDNFNFKHARYVISLFAQRGFSHSGDLAPTLAMVPTATEISKKCLFAAQPEYSDLCRARYENLVELVWPQVIDGRRFIYVPNVEALSSVDITNARGIVLNYMPIDTSLHKDENEIGMSHSEEIRLYLDRLVEILVQAIERLRLKDVVVCIASDHGSTKIPAGAHNIIDQKYYQGKAVNRHHRYIDISDAKASNPIDYDNANCYVIQRTRHGTDKSYLIARKYYRFIDTNESIYVHGGLTPEEVIVPFLSFVPQPVSAESPIIHLLSDVIRFSVRSNLGIEIANPNSLAIENLELNVAESDIPGLIIEQIEGQRSRKLELPIMVKRRPGTEVRVLNLNVTLEYQGKSFRFDYELPITAKSIMEHRADFDFDKEV